MSAAMRARRGGCAPARCPSRIAGNVSRALAYRRPATAKQHAVLPALDAWARTLDTDARPARRPVSPVPPGSRRRRDHARHPAPELQAHGVDRHHARHRGGTQCAAHGDPTRANPWSRWSPISPRWSGRVLLICSRKDYRAHIERISGCRAQLAGAFPHLVCDEETVETLDDVGQCHRAVLKALGHGEVAGIYNSGYASEGIEAALRKVAATGKVVWVGHEMPAPA